MMSCCCFKQKLDPDWAATAHATEASSTPEQLRNLKGTDLPSRNVAVCAAPTATVAPSDPPAVSTAAAARPEFAGFEGIMVGTIAAVEGADELATREAVTLTCSAIQRRGAHRDDPRRFEQYAPANVLDGLADTCWAGGRDHNQECWLQLEFDHEVVVTTVAVIVRYALALLLQVTRQGSWATVATLTSPDGAGGDDASLLVACFSGPGRIFRLVQARDAAVSAVADRTHGNLNRGMELVAVSLKGFRAAQPTRLAEQLSASAPPAVFLSYNWGAQQAVTRLAYQLECALGVRVWQDIGQLGGGDSLLQKVFAGMQRAHVVVSCMSTKYAHSLNCRREMLMAASLGVPVLLVRVDDAAELPASDAFLGQLFAAHPAALDLSGVDTGQTHDALRALLSAVRAELVPPAARACAAADGSRLAHSLVLPPDAAGGLKAATPEDVWIDLEVMAASASTGLPAVVPVPHSASARPLGERSERQDLAFGRPCIGSGNFYDQPSDWLEMHASCVTLPDGRETGRFSGARDGEGNCWIVVDLGCEALVDEVSIDFEVACASMYRIDAEVPGSLLMGADGQLTSTWKAVGEYDGNEGWCSSGELAEPVRTRAVRVFLLHPYFLGGGFSCWSIHVHGTSEQQPVFDYFVSTPPADLEHWERVKLIDDVSSKRRKCVFTHAGPDGLPTKYLPPSSLAERECALGDAEAVLVFISESTATSPHVAEDVAAARRLGKPLIPILWAGVGAHSGEPLPWPPADPVLADAFEDKIYIDFRIADDYSRSHALLVRVLAGAAPE